jgi:hypothetical protein
MHHVKAAIRTGPDPTKILIPTHKGMLKPMIRAFTEVSQQQLCFKMEERKASAMSTLRESGMFSNGASSTKLLGTQRLSVKVTRVDQFLSPL